MIYQSIEPSIDNIDLKITKEKQICYENLKRILADFFMRNNVLIC